MEYSNYRQQLEDSSNRWDVIVIGGGATGLGTAVESAGRGYRTLLLERDDFASGSSSRSTKLIHGGVRYLEQGNVALVIDALRERGHLLRNAPHLVHDLPFVVPLYEWWEGPFYGIGLTLYDILEGRLGLAPSRRLTIEETIAAIPTVETKGLRGGIVYHDGQFDDARLAISLVRTLVDLGGAAINYCSVTRLMKTVERITGVIVHDTGCDREYQLQAKVVINATGVFTDTIRQLDDSSAPPVIAPSQGIHLVVDQSFLPGKSAIMIPHTDDGRVLFAIPWLDRVIIGTTDTPITDISVEPLATDDEIDFLLEHAERYLSSRPERADILSVFAGLRPLVAAQHGLKTAALSRDHLVLVSGSGLVTVTGGKWTTYRHMGYDAVERAIMVGGLDPRPSHSLQQKIHGWRNEPVDSTFGRYGSDAEQVRSLCAAHPAGMERLHPKLLYLTGEVIWGVRHEYARTVPDILARRTRALFLDTAAAIAMAPRVAALMAAELGRDEQWQQHQIDSFRSLARYYLP